MAKTQDYLDYLDENIEISPANSQEEFQAAQTIAEVMRDHDLETSVEEFSAYPMGSLIPAIFTIVMFVSLLVTGLTEGVVHIVTLVLAVASVGVLLASHFLFDVFDTLETVSHTVEISDPFFRIDLYTASNQVTDPFVFDILKIADHCAVSVHVIRLDALIARAESIDLSAAY